MEESQTSSSRTHEYYHVLVEFAYRHVDFQMAELESVLEMHGVSLLNTRPVSEADLDTTCWIQQLPRNPGAVDDAQSKSGKRPLPCQRRPFVILSMSINAPFVPGQHAASATAGTKQEDIASMLLKRCTLVRSVMELWGCDDSLSECAVAVQTWIESNSIGRRMHTAVSNQSWKLTVHTLGSKYNRDEQADMRRHFDFLNLRGQVSLKEPDNEFVLIREVELDVAGGARFPRLDHTGVLIPENDKRPPIACYFGRALGGLRTLRGRGGVDEYSLKKRAYLGPTSMDAELSFIMTNLGHIKADSAVLDPFVGTGSILLSCALRGAYVVGTDIDIRVLRGFNSKENIFSNFEQYNLPRPEIIRSDNALYHCHFHNTGTVPMYDAIVCDPPYGIRAGARKSGSRSADPRAVLPEHRHDHIAQTKPYPVSDVMADLLDVAARALVMGGRLVYIIPSMASSFDESTDLPRHACLELVCSCYQPLSAELGRRMVAMKKVADYDESKRDAYMSAIWVNGAESADKVANLRDKILENAKKKPNYEAKLAIRKQKRKLHKEAKKRAKLGADKTSDED